MSKIISDRVIHTPLTFSRILLLSFLAVFSISGWLRVSQAIANREWIKTMGIAPGTVYFIASGVIWGTLFLAALLAVLVQLKGAGGFTISVAVGISIWRWCERLAFARSPLVNTGWLFEVVFNVALLLVLVFMMKGFPPSRKIE